MAIEYESHSAFFYKLNNSISETFGQLAFMDIDTKWHPTKLNTIANYYGRPKVQQQTMSWMS
jgi:hypothetical protein